jgi:hypothetical protein
MIELFAQTGDFFAATPQPVVNDRIALEVGDSKQPEFHPQLKLMRWDNEVNLSVRLIHDEALPMVSVRARRCELVRRQA